MSCNKLCLVAATAGAAFLGYCIYFDHKRRSAPDFKKKLREKRNKAKSGSGKKTATTLPDPRDSQAMQKFFLNEVQLGEELLSAGDEEGGIEHLSNAVAVCGSPQQLLSVLQQTLPPPIFAKLVQKLSEPNPLLMHLAMASGGMGMPSGGPPGGPPGGGTRRTESPSKSADATIKDDDELE